MTPEYPQRIVSLVPSQTELLHALGLGERVVGITKFCVHPQAWYQHKTRVGGTKTINLPKVIDLQPDLILANKEENEKDQVEALAAQFPTWTSDIKNLEDALEMIRKVGELTGTTAKAANLCEKIETKFKNLENAVQKAKKQTAVYLIWRKPWMAAGGDTFIHDMLCRAGFEHLTAQEKRYPTLDAVQLAALDPDTVLLSSEPYPFQEKHFAAIKDICPRAEIKLVDGEMFS